MIDSIQDYAVFLLDPRGKVLTWSQGARRLLGYTSAEIIGKNFSIFFSPADRRAGKPRQKLQQALTEKNSEDEHAMRRKNGSYFWTRGRNFPLWQSGKKLCGFVKIAHDITHHKQTDEQLKQSEERYRLVVENTSDVIQVLDIQGNYVYASPSHHRLLGHQPQALVGKNAFTLIHPDDLPTVQKKFTKAVHGKANNTTYRFRHKKGHYLTLEGTSTAIFNDEHQPYLVVSTAHDITARTELEQQKDAFIGIASHELKTPVTSLKAYTQMLQRRFLRRQDHEAALYLAKMDAQLNKLTNLISDLLDVTKIEAGRLLLHQELFDFDTLVKEIVDGIQLTTQHHRIIHHGSLGKKLYGDRDRIGQVLINLMTNALKYSPEADKIIVRVLGTKDAAVVMVQDFGIGISPKKQEKIFDRFFRVNDSRSNTFPGLGLGLFISAEIIKRQGGNIWVKSIAGKGSTFSFSLPLMPAPLARAVSPVSAPQPVRHG